MSLKVSAASYVDFLEQWAEGLQWIRLADVITNCTCELCANI
jgi:hypothetical protein